VDPFVIANRGVSPPDPTTIQRTPPLLRVLALSVVVLAIVVMIVLPAERGIDPTGFGRLVGLTEMGAIKVEIAEEMAADEALAEKLRLADSMDVADSIATASGGATPNPSLQRDSLIIVLPPLGKAEFRVTMRKGARVSYSWSTGGAPIDFTVFGDSLVSNGLLHLYNMAKDKSGKAGVIPALFNGDHGWRWRSWLNDSVTIRLRTIGEYTALREVPVR
jgi:hypothetical protein